MGLTDFETDFPWKCNPWFATDQPALHKKDMSPRTSQTQLPGGNRTERPWLLYLELGAGLQGN